LRYCVSIIRTRSGAHPQKNRPGGTIPYGLEKRDEHLQQAWMRSSRAAAGEKKEDTEVSSLFLFLTLLLVSSSFSSNPLFTPGSPCAPYLVNDSNDDALV
jgi:hypothetical protein